MCVQTFTSFTHILNLYSVSYRERRTSELTCFYFFTLCTNFIYQGRSILIHTVYTTKCSYCIQSQIILLVSLLRCFYLLISSLTPLIHLICISPLLVSIHQSFIFTPFQVFASLLHCLLLGKKLKCSDHFSLLPDYL